jgi:tetratricopeptide (TPR) repeat protein
MFAAAAIAVLAAFTGCQNISYSKLAANYHFGKANALFRENKYRQAITEYEATLKYNPNLTQAYQFLGESYKQLFKPGVDTPLNKDLEKKTLDALTKALSIEPNNKDIIYSLGDMYDKLRKFPEGEKLYLRIIEIQPDNMSNYYVLADFYKRYIGQVPGMDKKAESMYLRRIETDPDNPQGYAYAANYYENLPASAENIDQAIANYDKANDFWGMRIALEPNNAEAWLSRGVNRWNRAYRFQTRPGVSPERMKEERLRVAMEAKAAIEKAMALDPNYPEPYAHMSPLYKAVLAQLEPENATRYNAEADRFAEKYNELRRRAADRKKLEEELKK